MKSILLLLTYITALYISTLSATELTIPFGMPKLPDARLAISNIYDTPGAGREDWTARFGTKTSGQNIIVFYRKALEEAGFKIYSSADRAGYAMIAAKRGDDRITVSFKNKSDWVEADENEVSINAVYNK